MTDSSIWFSPVLKEKGWDVIPGYEQYVSSLKCFPQLEQNVNTPAGDGFVSKIDIFNNSVMVKIQGHNMDESYETFDIKEINYINNKKSYNNIPQEQTVGSV